MFFVDLYQTYLQTPHKNPKTMKNQKLIIISIILCVINSLCAQDINKFQWTSITAKGDASPRHENSFIQFEDKFYFIGGRGVLPVNVYDPSSQTWEVKAKSPIEINHFQGVVYKDAIYLMGAMTGKYPTELALENIWIYYPHQDKWEKGPAIPKDRQRGSSGAVLYGNKIYMVGGIEYGHTSGTNNYFDTYDLVTGKWEILTKAPHIRDHFSAIIANDKLYCIGGRNTSVHYEGQFSAFFGATIPEVDVYDLKTNKWTTLENELPVPTAAGSMVQVGNNLLYIGGESYQKLAHNNTQCLNLDTHEWTQLSPLNVGRHGTGGIVYKGNVYVAGGSPNRGGGNMNTIEMFSPVK